MVRLIAVRTAELQSQRACVRAQSARAWSREQLVSKTRSNKNNEDDAVRRCWNLRWQEKWWQMITVECWKKLQRKKFKISGKKGKVASCPLPAGHPGHCRTLRVWFKFACAKKQLWVTVPHHSSLMSPHMLCLHSETSVHRKKIPGTDWYFFHTFNPMKTLPSC